jgi:hypothetical protein
MISGAGWPIASAKRAPTDGGRTGSAVGPEHEHVALEGLQALERLAALGGARCVGLERDQQREGLRAGLRGRRREGRLVGGDDLGRQLGRRRALDEHADRQVLGPLDEVAELKPRVAHLLVGRSRRRCP